MRLTQPQPEPSLHAEGWIASCDLDGKGDQRPLLITDDFQFALKVKETYKTYESSLPSYISTLSNPMRRRHKDQLLVTESTVKPWAANFVTFISIEDEFYNAWEEDIAVVNIFFGKDTVMGEKVLMSKIYLKSFQSLSEASEWVLWTSLPPLEGSLASVLDSASSPSLRSSTGF